MDLVLIISMWLSWKHCKVEGDLTLNTITQKLLCFDVDGINTFQRSKSGGMEQVISTNYVPYFIGCIVWLIDAT